MSHARETTLTFFVMNLSPLTSEVYLFVNLFEKPVRNAVRHFSCYSRFRYSLCMVCKKLMDS